MISITHIKPRYAETDQMGIIHHSVYAIWYEQGRVQFCDDVGMPFDQIEKAGLMHAMVQLKSRFIRPAYFNQPLVLKTSIAELTKVKVRFVHRLFDQTDTLIHEGETLLAWLNQDFRPTNIAKSHPDIYRLLKEAEQTKGDN